MKPLEVKTFVTTTLTPVTLITTLKRVFIQFQTTQVTGGTLLAPTTATLADWTANPNPLLQLDATSSMVTNGQYSELEVQNINGGVSTTINPNPNPIPIFVVNGFNNVSSNLYQAWVEIPVGSNNFHVGSTYPYPIPASWIEPGVFNYKNPTPVFGKVIY